MIKLGWYRHFKGNQYRVLAEGQHTETGEKLVIYCSDDPRKVWARPEESFFDGISDRPDNVTGQKHRFEYIEA